MAKKKLRGFPVNGMKLAKYLKAEFGSIELAGKSLGVNHQLIYRDWIRGDCIPWASAGRLHYYGYDVRGLIGRAV